MLKDDEKEDLEDFKNTEALRFSPAGSEEGVVQRDEFGEGREFWKAMDNLVFMFYNYDKAPLLLAFGFSQNNYPINEVLFQ